MLHNADDRDIQQNENKHTMDLIKRIDTDLKDAMKQRDELRLRVLRGLRSVIKNAEIAKGKDLEESELFKLIQTEIKKRKESIEAYTSGGRKELAEQEEGEAQALSEYLPKQLSTEELDVLIKKIAEKNGVTEKKDFGKLIGMIMKEVGARADGNTVKERIQTFLQ